jgi:hypothetical protein
MKRSPIKRRTKPRKGQPTMKEKAELRRLVYDRAGGRCELQLGPKCRRGVLPWDGDVFDRAHLCHVRARSIGGTWDPSNLRLGCAMCHLGYIHTEGRKAA